MANQMIIRCKILDAPAKQALAYWRKKASGQSVRKDGTAKLTALRGMGDFVFNSHQASTISEFIKTEYGFQPEICKIRGGKELAKHAVLVKRILEADPAIWQVPQDAAIYSALDHEIECVYPGASRQVLLQNADNEAVEATA